MTSRYWLLLLSLFILNVQATPLDDYVNAPDPHYKYDLLHTYKQTGYSLYVLNMTSQKWYDG